MNFLKLFLERRKNNKLLMLPVSVETINDGKVNINQILLDMKKYKYNTDFYVKFIEINQSNKRRLLRRIEIEFEKNLDENSILLEGIISNECFIAIEKGKSESNKIGQIIITENSYFDITTRERSRDSNYYSNIHYIENHKNNNNEELYEFDSENELYYKKIVRDNITFSENAHYGNENENKFIEKVAQPSADAIILNEYSKITGLPIIKNNLSKILKANPYLVNIEAKERNDKEGLIHRISITKVFKSKKECVVGYRPEIILLEGGNSNDGKCQVFRLLPEGMYVDNNSFKKYIDGRYGFKKVNLYEIENLVKKVPFSLAEETKGILRNGVNVPNYIKKIYEKGIEKIRDNCN